MATAGAPGGARIGWRRVTDSAVVLWLVFALVHLLLIQLAFLGPNQPLGDVTGVYKSWMAAAVSGAGVVGIDGSWVYPILAIIPMGLAAIGGLQHYELGWLILVSILDAAAFAVLIGLGRRARRAVAAWWWLAFLALLGSIAVGRIDAVTVPLAIVAVLLVAGRPRLAAVLLSIATWMKIWPVAIIGALLIASRARLRIVVAAAATSAVIVVIALVLGSGWNVLSFIGEQTGRGLQIEAPVSLPWLWQTALGSHSSWVYYDRDILTFQVFGPGTALVSAIMTPLLVLALGLVAAIGIRAMGRGTGFARLFPPLSLAFVMTLIVVNKVGSPQYMTWLAAPVIIGLVFRRREWAVPAWLALALAGLTQVIYPFAYNGLLTGDALTIAVLTVRNLLEIVLLVWAVTAVWKAAPARAVTGAWQSDAEPLERAAD